MIIALTPRLRCATRPARREDAGSISRVIIAALRETNAGDYSAAVIARVEQSFSPDAVLALLERRLMYVAIEDDEIVGTVALDGRVVRTVFVAPACQGRGVGRQLMAAIERAAAERGVAVLTVPSSITAEAFYAGLGHRAMFDPTLGALRMSASGSLPRSVCSIGVIAGTHTSLPFTSRFIAAHRGSSWFIAGPHDGLVSLERSSREGADWIAVRAGHTFPMIHPDVVSVAAAFLAGGRFPDRLRAGG